MILMKFKNLGLLFLLVLSLLSFNACANMDEMNTDITTLKSDVAALKKEKQGLQDLRKELAGLSAKVDDLQNNLQEVTGRVDENQHSLDKTMKEIKARLGSSEKNTPIGVTPSSLPDPGVTPPNTPPTASLNAEEVYNNAYRIFQEGRYPESRAAFSKFLQQFSQTKYSGNAQFWIGESYFKEGKTEEAILAFEDVLKKYPQGNKVPDALVKQGICFKALGDKDNARIILQRVIDKYPNTPQSDIARNELKKLL
jgi:tol-pal system protein YbgF